MTSSQDALPLDMADDRQSARRQVSANVRATGQTDHDVQQDQRQHIAGGQPLPPDASMSPTAATASSNGRRPSDLSSYAHAMLQHTKQQMDATNGSPPPAHLRVAGPAGAASYRHEQENGDHGSRTPRHHRGSSQSQSQSPSRSQHHHRHSSNNYSGNSSRSSSMRHGHRTSLTNGTTAALPNGI
ncbi:hypothetical protein SCUCBS95973_004238 [Sporothrix curviconia]|uniref:Uncharacterized protein n=1 Tax=Sporothrix curviconia TaxID=1260050 RepID=A0ABP0BM34_9PEZI